MRPTKTAYKKGTLENKGIHCRWVMRKSRGTRRPWIRRTSKRVVLEETEEKRLKSGQGTIGFK